MRCIRQGYRFAFLQEEVEAAWAFNDLPCGRGSPAPARPQSPDEDNRHNFAGQAAGQSPELIFRKEFFGIFPFFRNRVRGSELSISVGVCNSLPVISRRMMIMRPDQPQNERPRRAVSLSLEPLEERALL